VVPQTMFISPAPLALKTAAGLLLLLACSLPVLAAPAIYDVEVIIFTNNTSGDNGERSSKPAGVSGNTGAFRDGEFTYCSTVPGVSWPQGGRLQPLTRCTPWCPATAASRAMSG
jgi:hypothetical protein